jgi:hypothetical protein
MEERYLQLLHDHYGGSKDDEYKKEIIFFLVAWCFDKWRLRKMMVRMFKE